VDFAGAGYARATPEPDALNGFHSRHQIGGLDQGQQPPGGADMNESRIGLIPGALGVLQGFTLLLLFGLLFWLWKAYRLKDAWWSRLLAASPALALLYLFIGKPLVEEVQFRAKLAPALAKYQEYCKKAGLHIYRTVPEPVEGIVLMKWRPDHFNQGEQFTLDDPLGQTCHGQGCLLVLLRPIEGIELTNKFRFPSGRESLTEGYKYIESIDPIDGKMYRFSKRIYRPHDRDSGWLEDLLASELIKIPIEEFSFRYGITWEDLSTLADREQWIAGSSLKMIDLQTGEVLAERISYMFNSALRQNMYSTAWDDASITSCGPDNRPHNDRVTSSHILTEMRDFSTRIVKPQ
jgi:hypothetical protein